MSHRSFGRPIDVPARIRRIFGGTKFEQATGCKEAVITKSSLTYQLPPNRLNALHMNVTLNDKGFYDVRFYASTLPDPAQPSHPLDPIGIYKNLDLAQVPALFRQVTAIPYNQL